MALSADQRRAFAMLATAGQDGIAQALLSAHGFDATMIAGLVLRGLAALTMEKVRANGKLIAVAMVRITETDGAVSLPRIELIRELGSYPNRIRTEVIRVPKCPSREPTAADLTARERVLLFCVASGTDRRPAGAMGEVVTGMIVKGLVVRDAQGRLSLTDRGPAVQGHAAGAVMNRRPALGCARASQGYPYALILNGNER
jgi:hypothetical protein